MDIPQNILHFKVENFEIRRVWLSLVQPLEFIIHQFKSNLIKKCFYWFIQGCIQLENSIRPLTLNQYFCLSSWYSNISLTNWRSNINHGLSWIKHSLLLTKSHLLLSKVPALPGIYPQIRVRLLALIYYTAKSNNNVSSFTKGYIICTY